MSLIKLSQYPKYSVPLEITGQISQLKRAHEQPRLHENERLNGLVCTLSSGDRILGFTEICLDQGQARLVNILLDESQRQKGLGTILLTHTLRKLYTIEHDSITLRCDAALRSFFERLGFNSLDTRDKPGTEIEMRLPSLHFSLNHYPETALTRGRVPRGTNATGPRQHQLSFSF